MESSQREHEREKYRKMLVVFGIVIPVALLHFVTGPGYTGPFPAFVNGYLIDILLPLAVYFLLVFPELQFPVLQRWYVKSMLVFAIGAGVEIAQFFGVPIFGQTFDPVDFVMYATGALLAAVLDTAIFPRLFPFWARQPVRS
ncbi:MAG: hypothetical protein JXA78_12730 [Anaerolineales bacterium]|nr:hypothetical protein [Anaerolineales bacterium]